MTGGSDVVAELIQLAREVLPAMDDSVARQLEGRIRERWGGTELGYIAKQRRVDTAVKHAAVEEVRRSGRVVEVATKHGISRRTMYRLIKR